MVELRPILEGLLMFFHMLLSLEEKVSFFINRPNKQIFLKSYHKTKLGFSENLLIEFFYSYTY